MPYKKLLPKRRIFPSPRWQHRLLIARTRDRESILRKRIKDLEESIRFFENRRKKERELWICERLVRALGVRALGEFVSVEDDPPDYLFGGAKFEVKEVQDEGRRRHDEYKDALARARVATDTADLLEDMDIVHMSVGDFAARAMEAAAAGEAKYGAGVVAGLDLIVYVNLDGWIERGADMSFPQTYESAWRSVSMVENSLVAVLHASADAPNFIRDAVSTIYAFPHAPDTDS